MSNFDPHKNHRILVIDDNTAIHEDLRKILVQPKEAQDDLDEDEIALFGDMAPRFRLPVFEIDSAHQGQEGLDLAEKSLRENHPYAMAFVDVRMPPGWDGIETTVKIWQKYPDLQVVICSAYSDYSAEEMLKKLGYSDRLIVLKKPFETVEVLQLAISLTEKWRLYQQAKLRLDELERMVHERTLSLETANSELAAANEMLKIAAGKTQKMAGTAMAERKANSEFLAEMTHEIRTLMSGVIGMIDLLLATELSPEQEEYARSTRTSAETLVPIINCILDFSEIEPGGPVIGQLDAGLPVDRAHEKGRA